MRAMLKKIILSSMAITAFALISLLFFGCDQVDESAAPKEQVKTYKVVAKKEKKKVPERVSAKSAPAEEVRTSVRVPAVSEEVETPEVISEKASEEMLYGKVFYDPQGKLDPFEPLFAKRSGGGDALGSGETRPTTRQTRLARLTPLEKLDISQLKLVGIVKTPERNMAMVEEAGGKGYVVRKGTYIGVHSGQVVEIGQSKLVIEEEVENYLGKIVVRTRELKLQKPLGEE